MSESYLSSAARRIIAQVCNEHKNSDLRADSRAVIAALDEKFSALEAENARLKAAAIDAALTGRPA